MKTQNNKKKMKKFSKTGLLTLIVLILSTATFNVSAQRYHKFLIPESGPLKIATVEAFLLAKTAPAQNAWWTAPNGQKVYVKCKRDPYKRAIVGEINYRYSTGQKEYDRPIENDTNAGIKYYFKKAKYLKPTETGPVFNTAWSDSFYVVELHALDLTNPLNECIGIGNLSLIKVWCANLEKMIFMPSSEPDMVEEKAPITVMDNCDGSIVMGWYKIKDNGDTVGIWSADNIYYYDFRDKSWFKKIEEGKPYVQICLPKVQPEPEKVQAPDLISNPPPAPKKVKFWQFKMKRLAKTPKNNENDSGDESEE